MGLRCVVRSGSDHRQWRGTLRASASVLALSATCALVQPAWADVGSGTTVTISSLSGSSTTLAGGTLQLDASKTYSRDFTLKDSTTSTIDVLGSTSTFSGKITSSGALIISDSKGGGVLTLSNYNNDFTGAVTINSGATLALTDSDTGSDSNTTSGTISDAASLTNNGTFDISGTVAGASVTSLAGSGSVVLGSETLTISDAASSTWSGVISGKGGLIMTEGTMTISGANTYTGSTVLSSGTLTLTGAGSIANSSTVYVYGTLDGSAANSFTMKSLGGSGTVVLGSNNLILTAAGNSFTGVISGTGGIVLNGGTEYLTGDNTFTGNVTINSGELDVGSTSVAYNVVNSGVFSFYTSSTVAMTGVISGTGTVTSTGTGVSTISAVQTYTGATTITTGTIKLSGVGSIASSSLVTVNGAFDIADTTSGTTINGLAGTGSVRLGEKTLTITGSAASTFSGAITGTGGITITGGTQTFAGTSTYTGDTTVNGGTLILKAGESMRSRVVNNSAVSIATGDTATGSATIGSLTGAGSVTLGANTLVISNANDTYSGAISGSGGLWISSGTETLSGVNTYTGSTTVSGGTLILASTGSINAASKLAISGTFDASAITTGALSFASLSGSGAIKMGTNSLTLTASSGTFSGSIQGSSGLIISGGTQILSGTNSYTGGTTINSGATLQLGVGSSAGAISGDVLDNGTLIFSRNDTYIFSGAISGTGKLTQSGTGTTVLTGTNTYTGGTTISSGTLQIGNGSTTGSITGAIVNNSQLAFNLSGSTSYTGGISGTGAVSFLAGTTTFSGDNTYTGATTIASGASLVLAGAASVASSSQIIANGTFNVSAVTLPTISSLSGSGSVVLGSQYLTLTSASTAFSGAISGTGGLIVKAGTQTLSGTSSYTGATTINGGTLSVTGSIASSSGIAVNSGGTLSGTGTVSSITVASGGTINPGTSTTTGTLTVSGNATFASGSTYNVVVDSTSASKLVVSGTASLAGSLTVTSTDGTYLLGQKVSVLSAASGISGSFTYAENSQTFTGTNGALFKSVISSDANNVYLTVDLSKLSPALPTTATQNQSSVVAGIDAAIAKGNTLNSSIEGLGNDTSTQLVSDANQLSGEIGANISNSARALFSPFVEAMFAHINPGAQQFGGVDSWVMGIGSSSLISGQEDTIGSHKFRSDVYGVAFGTNWRPWNNVIIGAAVSAETSTFHLTSDLGKGNAKSIQAGFYGLAQLSPHFYNAFALGGSFAQIKTDRIVTVSGTDELTGKANTVSLGGRYEAGITFSWLTPYVAAEDQYVMASSFSESAASGSNAFALHYASRNANLANVEAGVRNQWDFEVNPRWILTPDFKLRLTDRLAYVHDFSDQTSATANFLDAADSSFGVRGADTGKDGVRASVGADFMFDGGLRITSHLDTTFTKRSQAFTGFAGLAYQW